LKKSKIASKKLAYMGFCADILAVFLCRICVTSGQKGTYISEQTIGRLDVIEEACRMNKNEILKELDAAIDKADMAAIDRSLSLSAVESQPIEAEDVKLFSARVKKLHKENQTMIKSIQALRVAVVAAAVLVLGVSVYASGILSRFSFAQDDKFIMMHTTEDMTEEEARDFVSTDTGAGIPDGAEMTQPAIQEYAFESVRQAEEQLDMALVLPTAMPDMALEGATGQSVQYGDGLESRTVWLNYADESGRLFGVTVVREVIAPGRDVTGYTINDMDPGSLGYYTSQSGVKYTLLTESDDTGERTAHIATVTVDDYEYSLVFCGFEENERQAIIDSADLSVYGK